jgi:hypothetical protein
LNGVGNRSATFNQTFGSNGNMAHTTIAAGTKIGIINIESATIAVDGCLKIVAKCNEVVREFVFAVGETVKEITNYIKIEFCL